jgi:hypothetical protein
MHIGFMPALGRPFSTSNPLRRVQFGLGAARPHSSTPSLRVAGFEDDDEDEYEAPCESWATY